MRPDNLPPGTTLGDFRIETRLGAGGMGVVYEARQLSLDRLVALKVIDGSAAHPDEIERFKRAARAGARLQHPNVVATHAVGEVGGLCYLAMERIDGVSFQQAVAGLVDLPTNVRIRLPAEGEELGETVAAVFLGESAGGGVTQVDDLPVSDLLDLLCAERAATPEPAPAAAIGETPTACLPGAVAPRLALSLAGVLLTTREGYHRLICAWVRDAARGMQYAHDCGIVHRDVKPANVMVDRHGRVRVIDFGLARCFDDSTLTAHGQLLGTPLYMSPEQVTGRIGLTAKSDVYSLGLVLYELLCLQPPITASNREELYRKILVKPLTPLTEANPTVSRSVEAIVHKAAAKDPDDRYESAGALADDIGRYLAGKPVYAPTYAPPDVAAEILGARPSLVAAVCAHMQVGMFGWASYGFFLHSLPEGANLKPVPLPLLSLGQWGAYTAFLTAAFLGLASRKCMAGAPSGYRLGIAGQVVLIVSAGVMAVSMNALREYEGTRLFFVVAGLALSAVWSIRQLYGYCSKPVRSWFEFARKLREEDEGGSRITLHEITKR